MKHPATPSEATLAFVRSECFALNAAGQPINRGGFVPFVDSLAPHFQRIEVAAPVVPGLDVPAGAPTFQAPNVVFRALPNLKGSAHSLLGASAALTRIRDWASDWDLVNLRAPDNFLPAVQPFLTQHGVPHYVQLVSHPFEAQAAALERLHPILRPVGRALWKRQQEAIRRACDGRLVIAHGTSVREIAEGLGARAIHLASGSLPRAELDPAPRRRPVKKLLFVGRIDEEKGLDVLLRALAELRQPSLQLTLVGWPTKDLGQRLRALAEQLDVEDQVYFRGALPHGPELYRVYREADLFVLPSVSEGTPRVLGEAMAFGLPIVSTTAGGIPDLVTNFQTGLLATPGSHLELAGALRRLIEDEALRRRLVETATKGVEDRTLESVAARHVQLLREAWPELSPEAQEQWRRSA